MWRTAKKPTVPCGTVQYSTAQNRRTPFTDQRSQYSIDVLRKTTAQTLRVSQVTLCTASGLRFLL